MSSGHSIISPDTWRAEQNRRARQERETRTVKLVKFEHLQSTWHCPGCGKDVVTDCMAASPAPCGCDWVWDYSNPAFIALVAVPHRSEEA